MKLDRSQVDRVEKDISPPMRYGITIPVTDKGQDTGVSVYVAVTPFMLGDSHRKSKARHFMKEVAKALYLS